MSLKIGKTISKAIKYLVIPYILGIPILSYPKAIAKPQNRIVIPNKIYFANVRIYMCNTVKSKIQTKVDNLRRWKFKEMLNKANLLFPIIEPIIKKEGIPNDLKYLAMHESGLKVDCISATQDVGIWQFHPCAIEEVGIKVNDSIDERMHIIYATRAMAKKMKINYSHFNNWVHTILAYNKGKTGAINFIKESGRSYIKKSRGKSVYLGVGTPLYIIYVLSYKIAFQKEIGKSKHPLYILHLHKISKGDNLRKLQSKFGVPKELLMYYNKWMKCYETPIPEHKKYEVILPLKHRSKKCRLVKNRKSKSVMYSLSIEAGKQNSLVKKIIAKSSKFPKIEHIGGNVYINGILGVIIKKSMTLCKIHKYTGITKDKFVKYNELLPHHKLKVNEIYYLQYKAKKACIPKHIVREGDTWWNVSQKYGIRKKYLLHRNNRSCKEPNSRNITPGRLLYLNFIRPKNKPIEYIKNTTD